MATFISTIFAEKLKNHIFGIEVMPMPSELKIALFKAIDGIEDNNPVSELVDPNYVRHPLTFNENNESNAFHFEGMTVDVLLTHIAVVGLIDGVEIILFAQDIPSGNFAAGEPIWLEEGKVTLSFVSSA